jgi:hypothetical protein
MKINLHFLLVAAVTCLVFACTNPPAEQAASTTTEPTPAAAPAGKGVLSLTHAPDLATADYDKVIAEIKTRGEYMKDWTYHAMGLAQPKGFVSLAVYPDQATFTHRRGILKEVFTKLSVNPPAPQVHEVSNIIAGAQPAAKPATAFIADFSQANMKPEDYLIVLKELEAKGQGTPSGRMYHVSYMTDAGIQVIDVWESEAQFKAFGEVLMPILASKGIEAKPTIYPLYNSFIAQ